MNIENQMLRNKITISQKVKLYEVDLSRKKMWKKRKISFKFKGHPTINEFLFFHNKRYWKKDYHKLKINKIKKLVFHVMKILMIQILPWLPPHCHIDEQVLDSRYTHHMCPTRDWFSSSKRLDGRTLLMGNDNAYKIHKVTLSYIYIIVGTLPSEDMWHASHSDTWHTLSSGSPSSGSFYKNTHDALFPSGLPQGRANDAYKAQTSRRLPLMRPLHNTSGQTTWAIRI